MPKKPIYGIGINDSLELNSDTREYMIWACMFERCYSLARHACRPTYIGCSVHPLWHKFSAFKTWYDREYREGYQLDKDILIPGNKVYGPYTCCFVPRQINSLLLARGRDRGALPCGVCAYKQGYRAQINKFGRWCSIGTFKTVEAAAACYAEAKAQHVREVADASLAAGEITRRVHAGLLRHAKRIQNAPVGGGILLAHRWRAYATYLWIAFPSGL